MFAFQIYGDFSGYSDIAIGTARLFGFRLMRNFAFPYFSRDIAEFWRKWHISLSTWFRDYLYIPLGGSKGNVWMKVRNTFIIFIVSGFWHGANWTFIMWGLINALYFLPLMIQNKNRRYTDVISESKIWPGLKNTLLIGKTFLLTTFAWIFFRSETISQAFDYIRIIFSESLFSTPEGLKPGIFIVILIFSFVEWLQRDKQHGLQFDENRFPRPVRWIIYYVLIIIIMEFGGSQQEFIYFQF